MRPFPASAADQAPCAGPQARHPTRLPRALLPRPTTDGAVAASLQQASDAFVERVGPPDRTLVSIAGHRNGDTGFDTLVDPSNALRDDLDTQNVNPTAPAPTIDPQTADAGFS